MWVLLALLSAVFLGFYDVIKKYTLNGNAVIPVLFFACLSSLIILTPLFTLSHLCPDKLKNIGLYIPEISYYEHILIITKSIIVVSSWILAYFALRNLPITIVAPIRATGPLWTLIGAIIIFSEKLNSWQWIGIIITLSSFYLFSLTGKAEGIYFKKNKWIWAIICATFLGAISSLYDKYLMQQIDRMAVQAWFTFYQVVLLLPFTLIFYIPIRKKFPFIWKWTIPLIGLFLLIADFTYFYALSIPCSLVSIVSATRRSGVVIAFFIGAIIFKEKNRRKKAVYLIGIFAGILFILLGTR